MTDAQEGEARKILEHLCAAYPNHPWSVRVYDGGFFIRHLDFPANWGMNYRSGKESYSASAMGRQVIRMAGEYLERANLKRGMGDGTPIRRLDGLAERFQPYQPLPETMTITAAPAEERAAPMPQVSKELQ